MDYTSYYMRRSDQEERRQENYLRSLMSKRMTFLNNPNNLDRLAASVAQRLSPSTKVAKKSKFASDVDAVDSVVPDDHPMKGFAPRLRDEITKAMMDDRTLALSPMEIADYAATAMLSLPGRSGKADIATESYEYKREADASWFGIGGEDEDVRKPAFPTIYKSYDAWLEGRKKAEHKAYLEDPIYSKEGFAGFTAAGAAAGTVFMGGLPVGTLIGAAGGALSELIGAPLHHAIKHSDWYQSKVNRSDTNWPDTVKAVIGSMTPYLATAPAEKALASMFTVPKAIGASMTVNLARPATVTREVIASGEILKATRAATKEPGVLKKFVDKVFFDDKGMRLGYNPDFIQSWKNAFAKQDKTAVNELSKAGYKAALTNEEVIAKHQALLPDWDVAKGMPPSRAYAHAIKELDSIAVEQAMQDTDGIYAGIMKAYQKKKYRDLADSVNWESAEEQIHAQLRADSKAAAKGQNVFGRAIKETATEAWDTPGRGRVFGGFDPITSKPRFYAKEAGEKATPVPEAPARTKADMRKAQRSRKITTPVVEKVSKESGPDAAKVKEDITARSASFDADPRAKDVLEKTTAVTQSDIDSAERLVSTPKAISEAEDLISAQPGDKWRAARDKINARKAAAKIKAEKKAKEVKVEAVKAGKTGRHKVVRESADTEAALERDVRNQFTDIDPEGALQVMGEYDQMLKAGDITAEEALVMSSRLQDSLASSANTTPSGFQYFLDQTDNWFVQLRRIVGNKTFMALMGLGAGVYGLFSPDEAEAGVLSSVVKGLKNVADLPKAQMALIRAAKTARLSGVDVAEDTMIVAAKDFQRGLKGTSEVGPIPFIRELPNLIRTIKSDFPGRKFMNPYQMMNMVLPGRANLAINPGVFRASFSMAEYSNSATMSRVIDNWVREYPFIKSERVAIAKMFEPLTESMQKQVAYDFALDRVKVLKKEMERLVKNKKFPADVKEAQMDVTRAELEGYENTVKELAGSVEKFHQEYLTVAEQAAKQFPQAKIYYALDDTAEFKKYPFMKKIALSPEEKEIVGIMREQMLHYKARIDELGVPTISGPYVAHVLHPKFNVRQALNQFGGESARAAYMRFYRRSINSRPLLPDIDSTMRSYVSDTERRIQQQTFTKDWEPVRKRVQGMPVLHEAFEELERGVNPISDTRGNRIANFYSSFEVFKRLFLNPSAGLKHLIKVSGDIASAGFKSSTEAAPRALDMTFKRLLTSNPMIRSKLTKAGISLSEQDKLLNSFFNSIVPAKRLRERIIDWGLDSSDEYFHGIRAVWQNVQNVGSAWINLAELFDRGLSISAGLNLAAKKGLTIEQSMYGIYDMILKNNFLSREFNPRWFRNPKIRAAFLFQGTPYKILERRVVNAVRSGKVISDLGKKMYGATKSTEGRRMLLKDLRDMRAYVKAGENQLKSNLIIDTLRQDTDFYGTPIVSQFAKDILIGAAATYGGASAGMNLMHHFFHLPFLSTRTKEPVLAISPGLQALNRGWQAWLDREEGDDEWLFNKVMRRWLGTGWYAALPDTVKKARRLSENDIPEIYQDSKFRYLFAIPGAH